MTDNKPLVSIVLPTFNGRRFLKESVQSCLNQDYRNIELVIVLDASMDDSEKILDEFHDNRIKKIKNEKNQGLVESLNIGFKSARGDFLTWTSDDNIYEPQAISTLSSFLVKELSYDFVYSNYNVIDDNSRFIRAGKVCSPQMLDVDNYVGGCFLYRRKVYENIGAFNPQAFLAEDYEYWLRVRQSFKMRKIEPVLYQYRLHSESLTIKHREENVQAQVKKIREQFIPKFKSYYYRGLDFYQSKDLDGAKKCVGQAFVANPFYWPTIRMIMLLYLSPSAVGFIRNIKHKTHF